VGINLVKIAPAGGERLEQPEDLICSFEGVPYVCLACGGFYDGAELMGCLTCGARYFSANPDHDYCPGCRDAIGERIEREYTLA
jgi:hypothetical protein